MSNIKIQQLKSKLLRKENAIPIVISITLSYYLLGKHFIDAIWTFDIIALLILFLIIWLMAGFIVLKSFFASAAELSLLIFLAQSYCNSPNPSIGSNNALKSLMILSILYIIFISAGSLYNILKEFLRDFKNEGKLTDKIITAVILLIFLFFMIYIIQQIGMVISPIVNDICVFKQ
jgi:hypothetical protein